MKPSEAIVSALLVLTGVASFPLVLVFCYCSAILPMWLDITTAHPYRGILPLRGLPYMTSASSAF